MEFAAASFGTIPIDKRIIAGRRGSEVAVYVLNAKGGASRPGILHMHGGGFVMGSAAYCLTSLQSLAFALDAAIVTVEYRLAPETHWSGSLEDNYTALRWLHDNSHELGVDSRRVAVMGESAGGGHAALLTIAARDRGELPIAFQCLTYPMLDDRTGSTRRVKPPIGTLIWNSAENRFGWTAFLGREAGRLKESLGVPARSKSLAGLPPAWMAIGSIDLFIEETIEYAKRLVEANVFTELHVIPGAYHGFDGAVGTPLVKNFNNARIDALKRGLGASASQS